MHWIDIVVIAVVVIMSIIGLSKGLFESVLSIFGTGLSLFVAIWASKPVSAFVNNIVNITDMFKKMLIDKGYSVDDKVKIDFLAGVEFHVDKVAKFLSTVVVVLALFILIKIAIWILSRIFDSATSNSSAVSGLNRLLGLVFGFAKGAFIVAIVLAIVSLVSKVAFTNEIKASIEDTSVTNFFYKHIEKWTEEKAEDYIKRFFGDPETEEETEDTGENSLPAEDETSGQAAGQ